MQIISLAAIVCVVWFEMRPVDTVIAAKNDGTKVIVATVSEVIDKEMGNILNMQSITLTITGISISLIALISTLLTTNREHKFDKMEDNLNVQIENIEKEAADIGKQKEELRNSLVRVDDDIGLLENLMVADSIFLNKTKEKRLEDLVRGDDFYTKYLYIQWFFKKHRWEDIGRDEKLDCCNVVYINGKSIIETYMKEHPNMVKSLMPIEVILLKIMVADVCLTMARINRDENRFTEAEETFNKVLTDFRYQDPDGYVNNGLGLVYFWRYKTIEPERKDLLEKAIYHYKKANSLNGGNKHEVYDNLGVVYMCQYREKIIEKYSVLKKVYSSLPKKNGDMLDAPSIYMYYFIKERGEELLREYEVLDNESVRLLEKAEESYRASSSKTKKSANPLINLADIYISKIRMILMLDSDHIILRSVLKAKNIPDYKSRLEESGEVAKKLGNIKELFDKAERYLERAQDRDPFKIDCYFKKAQLKTYHYLYYALTNENGKNNTAMDNAKAEIEDLFVECNWIDENFISTKYIKRMYYDAINNYEEARKVNGEIKGSNEQQWNKLYDNYVRWEEEQTKKCITL